MWDFISNLSKTWKEAQSVSVADEYMGGNSRMQQEKTYANRFSKINDILTKKY